MPAALLALVFASAPAAAQEPVLGSPTYVPSYGEGWGTVAPAVLSNGGVPSGVMSAIAWIGWGQPTATGTGTAAIYRPQGGYYPPVRAQLRVRDIGTCPGRTEAAYLTLEFRTPPWPGGPLGPWRKWSGSRTTCDYNETDPAYQYPKLGPGLCQNVGEYAEESTIQSIEVYRLGCAEARRAARRIRARKRPLRCVRQGCTIRVPRLRCRLDWVRAGETTGAAYPFPVQRLSCRRGSATMAAWLVLSYD